MHHEGKKKGRDSDVVAQVAAYGRMPPQAVELEEAVIGACMLEREALEQVMGILPSGGCFYVEAHRRLYDCMVQLHGTGYPVDLLTVTDDLRRRGELDAVGGAYALTQLTMAVLSSAHVVGHARMVYQKYVSRETIRVCSAAVANAYSQEADAFDLLDMVHQQLATITDGVSGDNATPVGTTYTAVLREMDELQARGCALPGVDTGYSELNRLTGGWQTGRIVLIPARPSQGKTALALNLAEHAVSSAISRAGRVDIYSLETDRRSLVRRLAAARLGIPLRLIREGRMSGEQRRRMDEAIAAFNSLPIYIDDASLTLQQITAAIRSNVRRYRKTHEGRSHSDGGLELPYMVIIDYIQLIAIPARESAQMNREQQIARISRELKLLARELDIIIMPLCQINREVESRADRKPRLSDIRESGALEQDADVAVFIWHEQAEGRDRYGRPNINTHLLVLKNKDSECGSVPLQFAGDIQRWQDPDPSAGVEQASFLTVDSVGRVDDW